MDQKEQTVLDLFLANLAFPFFTAVLIRMAHGLRSGRLGRDPAILQKLGHDPTYVDPIKTSRVLSERKPL
jgi:hypothetical protein